MIAPGRPLLRLWSRLGPGLLPFADAATEELPMRRLLRLSLFQVSTGMGAVLLIGTLNRVMIVELGLSAALVAAMLSLPLLFAPLRAIIGHRSDTHRSALGWRRVPYLWFGSLLQFGGLAIMPFALILLSGDTGGPAWIGPAAASLAFLLVGAGLHTVQTTGLALATDLAPERAQPTVVALLSVMLLLGMLVAALVFGALLAEFSQLRLIQVIQGSAVATMLLNGVALWKQEPRDRSRTGRDRQEPGFRESWRALRRDGPWGRRLLAAGIGTCGFAMQDVLLEPYGGQVLRLGVGATTALSALLAGGGVCGFALAARALGRGADAQRIAAAGALCGIAAFALVALAAPFAATWLLVGGTALIGLGSGLFAHATLTACMRAAPRDRIGLALGAWGAVQATAAGGAIAASGLLRDGVVRFVEGGRFGEAVVGPASGYAAVYLTEVALLFLTLAVLGPLVRPMADGSAAQRQDSPAGRLAGSTG